METRPLYLDYSVNNARCIRVILKSLIFKHQFGFQNYRQRSTRDNSKRNQNYIHRVVRVLNVNRAINIAWSWICGKLEAAFF